MWISSLALLFLLVGCNRGVDKPAQEADTSTFVVDPLTAVGEEGSADSTFANIATSRLLNFTACVKDVAVLEPVTNVAFTVSEAGKTIKTATTDSKGCLYWAENFPFTATNQETYFEVERTLTANSVHQGSVSLRLAVNPWKKGGEALRDLRFQKAPPSLDRSKTAQANQTEGGLVVETVAADLEIVRSAGAVAEANLQLTFSPKLRRTGMDGGLILENLNGGKFLVRTQLLAVSAEAEIPLSQTEEFKEAAFNKGSVQLRGQVKILRKIPREASLELNFEAIPVDAPQGLGSVKGRVSLGRLSSLTISKSAPLRLDAGLSFSAPLLTNKEEPTFGFELGKVRTAEVVVKELDSSGNPKLLELEFITCVRNSISQEKIQSQSFVVNSGGQTFPLTSDAEEGCLRWKQTLPFDFHARESFVRTEIQVQSANEFYGKEKVKRTIHLNLWKFTEASRLVVDEEYEGVPSLSVADGKSGSELLVPSAMFNFMGRTFEIDSHLNLSTTRKYRFEIQPKIRRLSRDKGWLPATGSGNGRYQVRFLLETLDENNPVVIAAQTIDAESRADVITSTVDFKINDLRLVASRMNLSIEILPLDGARSLETRPYSGTFDMGGFSVRLEPREGKIDDRMKIETKNSALSKSGAEIFAKANGHQMMDDAKLQSLGISRADVETYLQTGQKKNLGKLCALYYDPNGWFSSYQGCSYDPEAYLVLTKTEHLKNVQKSRLAGNPQSSSASMSAGINYAEFESRDESSSKSRSYSVDSGARLSVPLLDLIGLNIGIGVGASDSWNSSKSYSKGKSRGESRSADLSKQILVDEAKFDISGEVERCLLVANRIDAKEKKVFMACGSKPVAKSFQENYYLLYQPSNPSALVDAGASLNERPFIALVRGTQRFQTFLKVMQDPQATLNFSKTLPAPADLMREAENRYDGFFPALLTPTE